MTTHSQGLSRFGIRSPKWIGIFLGLFFLSTTSGCVRLVSNVLYMIKGRDAPAEFNELQEKKVAVMVSSNGIHSSDASSMVLARNINMLLDNKVKKIKLIRQDEVDRMLQEQQFGRVDAGMIGSRLGADYVVDVNVSDLKLKEGKTLYKGRCNSSVTVYKVAESGSPVFRKVLPEFVYPQTGAPVTDFDESTFQRLYLMTLANRIARTFYPYDPATDVAEDAAVASAGAFQ